ncbi:hypothetical protein THRCLA_21275 [Thraustotheca clavata]|uniref:Uncharacterized protein n=1 Tax=Thraustotheca clavata TaxID=74557 RepID=A0A1V9ZYA5_9STRA|nr:hypothetical protein THRCLA_21275 [Thraustotheca clavata]
MNILPIYWGEMQEFYPKTITPSVPLMGELQELYTFLSGQRPGHTMDLCDCEGKKAVESKLRELENWNFRLYLDEGREMQRGQQLKILSMPLPKSTSSSPIQNSSPRPAKKSRSIEIGDKKRSKKPRKLLNPDSP